MTDGQNSPSPSPGVRPPAAAALAEPRRAALVLAALLGLGGIVFLTFFCHWYDAVAMADGVAHQTINHAVAPSVFGLLFLTIFALNPLLRWLRPGLALRSRELFLVLALWLLGSVVGSTYFTGPALAALGTLNSPGVDKPVIRKVEAKGYLAPSLFLDASAAKDYYYGLSPDGSTRIRTFPEFPGAKPGACGAAPPAAEAGRAGPAAAAASSAGLPCVPWRLWLRPMAFWGPFLIVLVVFSTSLVRTVHRQWSEHELLTYPLAAVADQLIGDRLGRPLPDVCYRRSFWIGFGVTAFIYVLAGLASYFPGMVSVPLSFSHLSLLKEFSFLSKYCGREAYAMFRGMYYPLIIALAVLLPTEVSLTCWLGWILMLFGTGFYFKLTGEVITPAETASIQCGMYLAMTAVILAIGWREYLNVLRCALFARRGADERLRAAAGACRVFLLSAAGLWWLLCAAGLDWTIALAFVLAMAMVILLVARMSAETGIPWLTNFAGMAVGLPLKLLGAAALGPQGLAVMAAVSLPMDSDLTVSAAAQATTYGKLREGQPFWLRGIRFQALAALGVALAVAGGTFFSLRDNYSFGARLDRQELALAKRVDQAAIEISRLQVDQSLGESARARGLAKLRLHRSEPGFWRFLAMGAALVGLCAFLRMRFVWWPFHPLPLLFFNTWAMSRLFFSIMLGWLVKVTILRIWGGRSYANAKPFFVGVIAGQVAYCGAMLAVNSVYYLATRTTPPRIAGLF